MGRILLVDDEVNVLHALRRGLNQICRDENLRVDIFDDPEQALASVREVAFDLVISDYRMPQMSGVSFLKTVKAIQPDAVRMVLSASTDFETAKNAINEAAVFRFITKPWQTSELEEIIRLAIEQRNKMLEERRLADETRIQRGEMTPAEREAKRLEELEPGITKVNWGEDGSVQLDDI